MTTLSIRTSGWNYDHWRDFYQGVKRSDRLRHYATQFSAVEINASYDRLQKRSTYEQWRAQVPADFRFAVKANRYFTQSKKLLEPEQSLPLEMQRAEGLGGQLAAVLWQLPGHFTKNLERLAHFAQALTTTWPAPHAIEFRHPSWFDGAVANCLREHGIAVCQSDAADWPLWPAITADLVYIRLHGHTRTYASAYSRASLEGWARNIDKWLAQGHDVHVYFDNDAEGAAPRDALRLQAMLREHV